MQQLDFPYVEMDFTVAMILECYRREFAQETKFPIFSAGGYRFRGDCPDINTRKARQ